MLFSGLGCFKVRITKFCAHWAFWDVFGGIECALCGQFQRSLLPQRLASWQLRSLVLRQAVQVVAATQADTAAAVVVAAAAEAAARTAAAATVAAAEETPVIAPAMIVQATGAAQARRALGLDRPVPVLAILLLDLAQVTAAIAFILAAIRAITPIASRFFFRAYEFVTWPNGQTVHVPLISEQLRNSLGLAVPSHRSAPC